MQGPGVGPSQPSGYSSQAQVRFDAIGDAWRLFQAQMGAWIPAVLVYFVVIGILSFVVNSMTGATVGRGGPPSAGNPFAVLGPMMFISSLIQWVISTFFMGGLFRMATMQLRGQPISIGDMFSVSDVLPSLLVASLLIALAVGIGTMLCVIPGLVAAGLLMFTIPLIVDKRLGATEAMGLSWNALKGQAVMATLFYLIVAIIGGIGAALCGVGLLLTFPVFILSVAVAYRDFFMGQITPGSAASSPGTYPPPPIPEPPMR
jgi:uncharacterized membrane protein